MEKSQFNIVLVCFAGSLFLAGLSAFPMKLEDTEALFASLEVKNLVVALKLFGIGAFLFIIGLAKGNNVSEVKELLGTGKLWVCWFTVVAVIGVNGFTNVALMMMPDGFAMSILFGMIFAVCLAYNFKSRDAWLAMALGALAMYCIINGTDDLPKFGFNAAGLGLVAAIIAGLAQGYLFNTKVSPPARIDAGIAIGLCFMIGSIVWLLSSFLVVGYETIEMPSLTFLIAVFVSAFINLFCWYILAYHGNEMSKVQKTTCTGFEGLGGSSIQMTLNGFHYGLLFGGVLLLVALCSKQIVEVLTKSRKTNNQSNSDEPADSSD